MTATEETHLDKRSRTTSGDKTAETKTLSPLQIADNIISNASRILHKQIAPMVEESGKRHLRILIKTFKKSNIVRHMEEDETSFPQSVELKFNLDVDKMTEKSEDFKVLKEETDEVILDFKMKLKTKVITSAKLQIETFIQESKLDFVKYIFHFIKAFQILHGDAKPVADVTKHSSKKTRRSLNTSRCLTSQNGRKYSKKFMELNSSIP